MIYEDQLQVLILGKEPKVYVRSGLSLLTIHGSPSINVGIGVSKAQLVSKLFTDPFTNKYELADHEHRAWE